MNSKINLLKTFAIMLVVSGHLHYTLIRSLPTYAFHMALFFFISGMLFNNRYDFKTYSYRRFKSLILPFVFYCIAYIPITFLLYNITGKYWGSQIFDFECIIRFLTGTQLSLCCSLWFVPQLFLSLLLYWVLTNKVKLNNTFFYFIFALAVIMLSTKIYNLHLMLLYRTIFSLFFIHIGHFYTTRKIDDQLFSMKYLIIFVPLLLCIFLRKYIPYLNVQGILNYSFATMQFNNLWIPILPMISSLSGIYAILSITKILYKYMNSLKITNIVNFIGQNTYHIMANHILIFNVLTYSIMAIKGIPFDVKNSQDVCWVYSQKTLKYFYFAMGMLIPILGSLLYKKCSQKLC